jgi:hypothetical protein
VRKLLATIAIATLATVGAAAGTVGAQNTQVCPDLDTGKIDPPGDPTSVTITAPEGQVIVQVCVKAGSAQQEEGPEFFNFDPGVTETTVSHSSGKEISHYSVQFADAPPPTTAAPPTTAPPVTQAAPPPPPPPPPGPAAAPPAPRAQAPAARPPAPQAPVQVPAAAPPVAAQPRGVTG